MGYAKIENLYRKPEILECFALEKVHGTSAHVGFNEGTVRYFSGGENHERFRGLFDHGNLLQCFLASFPGAEHVTVFGEAFGGSQMGMSRVYGDRLRFIAFDVRIGDDWCDVETAAGIVASLGLNFVPYERGPLTLAWLDQQRDRPSLVAVVLDAVREGVVIRPIRECRQNNGSRVIVKHKRDDFRETATPRAVTPERLQVLADADAVAAEWVVPMRLQHVLQKTPFDRMEDMGAVIRAMQRDVQQESDGEVVWSKEVERAIGKATVKMLSAIKLMPVEEEVKVG